MLKCYNFIYNKTDYVICLLLYVKYKRTQKQHNRNFCYKHHIIDLDQVFYLILSHVKREQPAQKNLANWSSNEIYRWYLHHGVIRNNFLLVPVQTDFALTFKQIP